MEAHHDDVGASDVDDAGYGHATADPRLTAIEREPLAAVVEAQGDGVAKSAAAEDGVAVEAALVRREAEGTDELLVGGVAEAELDELDGERAGQSEALGEPAGHVGVAAAGHPGVELGQEQDVGVDGLQHRHRRVEVAAPLGVPRGDAHPWSERR